MWQFHAISLGIETKKGGGPEGKLNVNVRNITSEYELKGIHSENDEIRGCPESCTEFASHSSTEPSLSLHFPLITQLHFEEVHTNLKSTP